MQDFFRSVRQYPDKEDANGIVMRLIDGLGYRFYWATEGLKTDDYTFSPGSGCQTIGELVGHVWGLVNWIHMHVCPEAPSLSRPEDIQDRRDHIFDILYQIRTAVHRMDSPGLLQLTIEGNPFWHIINGPLSDALTHTGQITAFRRLNGNVVQAHHVFLGYQK